MTMAKEAKGLSFSSNMNSGMPTGGLMGSTKAKSPPPM